MAKNWDEYQEYLKKQKDSFNQMGKGNFVIGLLFLITVTVLLYIFTSFEVTIIFLIIDMSVGISYQFDKIYRLLKKGEL
jgi:hypothetical protein